MRALFVHQNFPGQYRHIAPSLARRSGVQVVGLGENVGDALPGVQHVRYKAPPAGSKDIHRYVRRFESAVFRGQHVARACLALKDKGFVPDIICCHPGWGEALYLKDVFPDAKTLYYFEFYYRSSGADVGFDPPGQTIHIDDACRVRTLNTTHLLSLDSADWGQTPTKWQASRFPDWARARMSVIHEGIDTDLIRQKPDAVFTLPDGRSMTKEDEVVSFIGRGLEPYRGFPTFMRALPEILARRPKAQIVMVGGDDPHYGAKPKEGGTWKEVLLAELGDRVDRSRMHFPGKIPHVELGNLMSISSAHVYLTYPFVLSWSLLEAMSSSCAIIGSRTPPVEEVITHGETGVLVDFFSHEEVAAAVVRALEKPEEMRPMRAAAREFAKAHYDLHRICLPQHLTLIDDVAAGRLPRP